MRRTFLLPTVVAVVCVCVSWSEGQDSLEARTAALLLRNGEVLEGRVSFEGDYCALILSHGELRIRRTQVAAIESSVDAIYREHIFPKAPSGVEGHVYLADWCLRHDLLGYAAGEITAAAKLAPKSHRVVALGERLEAARRPRTPKAEPTPPKPSAIGQQPADTSIDHKAIETFTVSVQSLLLNRCANAKCHGQATTSEFQLQRGSDGRPISRSVTLANLAATLRFVDRTRPAASRLLTTPIRPHADAKEAVFLEQHRKQYDLLVRWVEQLGDEKQSTPIVSSPVSADTKKQKPAGIAPRTNTLARPLQEPRETRKNPAASHGSDAKKSAPQPTGRDPFDPEEFNRRFFKKPELGN